MSVKSVVRREDFLHLSGIADFQKACAPIEDYV